MVALDVQALVYLNGWDDYGARSCQRNIIG